MSRREQRAVSVSDGGQSQRRAYRKGVQFGYFLSESIKGITRHRVMSLAAVIIMAACLLLTGSLALVTLILQQNLDALMDEDEFLAYVDDSLSDEEAMALEPKLLAIDNVAQATFISREEAWADYLSSQEDVSLYEGLPSTVVRHRYSIRVEDLSLLDDTIQAVEQTEGIVKIYAAREITESLLALRNVAAVVSTVLLVILIVVSLFIVYNAIKLATAARAKEIAIMRICGATNHFILMPFLYEGLILGIVSALIAAALQLGLYKMAVQAVVSVGGTGLVTLMATQQLVLPVTAVFLVVSMAMGVIGSVAAVRRYLCT